MQYNLLEQKVLRWALIRGIIPNSTPMTQAVKTGEEFAELLKALNSGDLAEAKDAYGDIVVTLIIGAHLCGFSLEHCLEHAYNVIKDRKGTLSPEGLFVKE